MNNEQYLKNLSVPDRKINVILDTDAYNEIDDQFAIAYLLKSTEKLNTVGICAAPFLNERSESPKDGMEKSFDEIIKLVNLCNCSDLVTKVYKGSETFLKNENEPVISPAAEFMAKKSKEYSAENPLYIVAIGAGTNVASALLLNPDMKENVVVVWLAGQARHMEKCEEFNLSGDYAAARVIMGCGVPFVQLPCAGVVDRFYTGKYELAHFYLNKTPLSTYLAQNTIDFCEKPGEDKIWSKVIWDVTAVAWLLNDDDRFMKSRVIPTVLPGYDDFYETDNQSHCMRYVYRINRDNLFSDLTEKLTTV